MLSRGNIRIKFSKFTVKADKFNFQYLYNNYRTTINQFDAEFLLTTTAGVSWEHILAVDSSYDPSHMSKYFDFINLMTYNMHDQREDMTAHHALAQKVDDRDGTTNVEWVLESWIGKGADPSKESVVLKVNKQQLLQ